MGQLLREAGLVPDRIVSSTAERARATADLTAGEAGCSGAVRHSRGLYLASAPEIVRVLAKAGGDASRLLVVGHNPGLEELVAVLTGCSVDLPTAALVEVRLDLQSWSKLKAGTPARFVNLWRPRELLR